MGAGMGAGMVGLGTGMPKLGAGKPPSALGGSDRERTLLCRASV